MVTKQIGVISDIHANRPALEAVLEDMPPVDALLCAGDIVGILGWNVWTVERIQDECDHVVFGNHDARVRPDFAYAPSFPAARDEHRIVTDQLGSEHIEWLAGLEDRCTTDSWILAHSRPVYQRDPGYPCHGFAKDDRGIDPRSFTRYGPHLNGRLACVGHTHEQHFVNFEKFPGQSGAMVNPGSTGAPWFTDAEYAVVDMDSMEADLRSVEYDNSRVRDQLESLGLDVGQYSNDGRL